MSAINIRKEFTLDTNPDVKFVLELNNKTAGLFNDIAESLQSARRIETNVNANHEHVILLVAWAKEQGWIESNNPRAEEDLIHTVIDIVRRTHEKYLLNAQTEAFIIAILNCNFHPTKLQLREEYGEVVIPDEYWDNTEENTKRISQLFSPPVPNRNKFHPLERKMAIITQFFELNPKLAEEVTSYAEEMFVTVLAEAVRGVDNVQLDEQGFQS